MTEFIIAIDSREQRPFTFESIDPVPATEVVALRTGDYSLIGHEAEIIIERKSVTDLFGSCGKGRKRFEKEILRMAAFNYAAIVCEADWQEILRSPPPRSKLSPKVIFSSMIAWEERYKVHFWPCPNRAFAEKVTYRMIERFYTDYKNGFYL